MHSSTIIIFSTLLPAAAVAFVQPTAGNIKLQNYHTTTRILATSGMSSEADIDIEHAKYCADHFGECSLDDIDRMRNGKYLLSTHMMLTGRFTTFVYILCSYLMLISHALISSSTTPRTYHTRLYQYRWTKY